MGTIDLGASIKYGWESVKKNFGFFLGLSIIYLLLTSGPSYDDDRTSLRIISFLIGAWLTGGLFTILLNFYDRKKYVFADLFTQTKYFWRILGANILLSVIIGLGFVLLIVPGVYLALRYQFTIPLIVDKDMGIIEAMGKSSEMTRGVKWSLLGFDLALLGLIILGAIVFVVGVFVAIPVVWLAFIHLYRNLLSKKGELNEK